MTSTPDMTDIDAIMELARAVEPAVKITPKFHLWSDSKGLWHANVAMDKYYVQTDSHDSPDGALKKLRAELTGLNQSFLKRITAALKRWVGVETPLRSVKDDAPVDPPSEPAADPPQSETSDKPAAEDPPKPDTK